MFLPDGNASYCGWLWEMKLTLPDDGSETIYVPLYTERSKRPSLNTAWTILLLLYAAMATAT